MLATALFAAALATCDQPIQVSAGFELTNPSAGQRVYEIRELGKTITVRVAGQQSSLEVGPPRHKATWITLLPGQSLAVESPMAGAQARIYEVCNADSQHMALRNQIREAYRNLSQQTTSDALLATQSTSMSLSFYLRHLAGQNALKRRENHLAAQIFDALALQLEATDRERAGVMRVAQADALGRAARYQDMVAPANRAVVLLNSPDEVYFRTRAQEALCLSMFELGAVNAALNCRVEVLQQFRDAQEPDAVLNASYNLAATQFELGQFNAADATLSAGIAESGRSANALSLGRAMKLRGQIHLYRGQLESAILDFEAARQFLESAPQQRERWLASLELDVADLYSALGLRSHALGIARNAMTRFDPTNEPARIAAATLRISLLLQPVDQSLAAKVALAGRNLFAKLEMPQELDRAELRLAQLGATTRRVDSAASWFPETQIGWHLLSARAAIDAKKFKHASALLTPLAQRQMSSSQQDELAILQSRMFKSDLDAAQQVLLSRMKANHARAEQSSSPVMANLLARLNNALCATWASNALAAPEREWLGPLEYCLPNFSQPKSIQSTLQDADIAQLAAMWSSEDRAGTLSDLPALKQISTTVMPGVGFTLEDFQRHLPDGVWAMVIVPSEPQSAAFWLSKSQRFVFPIAGAASLQNAIRALRNAVQSPKIATGVAAAKAAELSQLMFSKVPTLMAPKEIWVLQQDLLAGLPFALLSWPEIPPKGRGAGASGPSSPPVSQLGHPIQLVDSTNISWIGGLQERATIQSSAGIPAPITVITPSQLGVAQGLAELPNLYSESALIGNALARPRQELAGKRATPAALRRSLLSPGAWVHIGGHGTAKASFLGYTGMWLSSADGNSPEFMSWLSLSEAPLSAELAVLNVCQQADSSLDSGEASLSFATALALGGVNHVVAAMWPLSDSASARWLPKFYQSLSEQAANSASALRIAQSELKRSRAFRHPFYWAGLVHIQSVSLPDPAALVASH